MSAADTVAPSGTTDPAAVTATPLIAPRTATTRHVRKMPSCHFHASGTAVSSASAPRLERFADLIRVQQVRKVDAGARPQGVITPGAAVDVEQLVLAVARVEFVFQLDETVVVGRAQKPVRQRFEDRQLDRFHERAGAAELRRMLAGASGDHASDRVAILEKRGVRELAVAVSRNEILDHHFAGFDVGGGTLKEIAALGRRVRSPRLGLRRVNEVLLDGGLDGDRRLEREPIQLLDSTWPERSWRRNPQ